MVDDDRIERQIDIDAGVERVWTLVSEPGWWINDGTLVPHVLEERDGYTLIHDPKHGAFAIKTVDSQPPRYVSFRWLVGESAVSDPGGAASTLVEFWVDDRADAGVTLRVVESGFAALPVTEEQRRKNIEDNTEGWAIELAAARDALGNEALGADAARAAASEQAGRR